MLCTIYLNRLEELKRIFNRFSKKAHAVGLETSLNIGEPYVKKVRIFDYDEIRHCQFCTGEIPVDVVDIELEYPEYRLGNFTVAAILDHTFGEENAVYPCGNFEIPIEYRHGQGICEHCRTNHKRNKTVLLISSDGKYKQVGTSCLKEYTGVTDYSLVSAFRAMDEVLTKSDIEYGYYSGKDDYRDITDYLAYCIHYIRKYGYDSELKNEAMNRKNYDNITDSDYQTAEKVRDFFKYGEFNGSFLYNIHVHMQKDYTKANGFLAYAYVAYQKEMEKMQAAQQTEYYGNVGEKVKGIAVTGKILTTYNNTYGSIYNVVQTCVFQFTDSDGHVFIWKTSCDIPMDDGIFKGTISGTIKAHNEYKGIKQTVLTRVKVTG